MSSININGITEKIIGCAYRVSNNLGIGFVEKVYENVLAHDIQISGLRVAQQAPIKVLYDGIVVGDFFADLLVEEKVLVELKAVSILSAFICGEINPLPSISYDLKSAWLPDPLFQCSPLAELFGCPRPLFETVG
jgi:GxxExxY protein